MKRTLTLIGFAVMVLLLSACSTVSANEIVALRNPDYVVGNDVTEKYTDYAYEGEDYDFSEVQKLLMVTLQVAVVGEGQVGFVIESYDENNLAVTDLTKPYGPGTYKKIPAEFMIVEDAAVVGPTEMGVYCNDADEATRILEPGRYMLPNNMVLYYPTQVMLYRTLSTTKDPVSGLSLLDRYQAGETSICGTNAYCQATITGALLGGTTLPFSYDVEIRYQYVFDNDSASVLCAIGGPDQAISTYIDSPLRSSGRGITEQIDVSEIGTEAGRQELAQLLMEFLSNPTISRDLPIEFLSTDPRSTMVGGSDLQATLAQQAADLLTAQHQGDLVAQQLQNVEAQNELLLLQATGLKNALAEICQENDPVCMWVYIYGAQFRPFFNGTEFQQEPVMP